MTLVDANPELFLRALPEAFVITDGRGDIVFASDRFASLFGYASSETPGMPLATCIPSSDLIAHVLGSPGRVTLAPVGGLRKDGTPLVVEVSAAHVKLAGRRWTTSVIREQPQEAPASRRADQGQVGRAAGVAGDTARTADAEEALRQSLELLHAVEGNAPVGVWAIDQGRNFTVFEGQLAAQFGLTPRTFIGRSIDEFVGRVPAIMQCVARATAGEACAAVVRFGPVTVDVHYLPTLAGDGTVTGVMGVVVDITEQERMAGTLRESEELSRGVIDSLVSHVAVVDPEGTIVAVNDAWRAFAVANGGGPAGDWVGTNYFDVCRRAADAGVESAQEALLGIQDVLDGRVSDFSLEYDCHGPDAEQWVRLVARSLSGGRHGAVIMHIDITAERANGEMMVRLRAAEESERFRRDVLRLVSHELRTPLSVIHGYLSLLLDRHVEVTADAAHAMIAEADEMAVRIDDLIEHVLTMSRVDHGMLQLDMRNLSLDGLIRGAVAAAHMFTGDRPVHVAVPPETVLVTADETWIRQVLLNLMDNARKYSTPGMPIEVGAGVVDDRTVIVSVSDYGPPVPPDKLLRIFEPFERYRSATNATVTGFGLGLAISKGIIDAHGEYIWADVVQQRGLSVMFTLRRAGQRDSPP